MQPGGLAAEHEVERVVAGVRFSAFRALRLVGTTLGVTNLGFAALQYFQSATVTPALRAVALGQLLVIGSGWLFTQRTHRAGAAVHVVLVGALAALTLFALGFTVGATGLTLWFCVAAAIFYGRRGALVALGLCVAMLAANLLRLKLLGVPATPGYGVVVGPMDLSLRWSAGIITLSGIVTGAVVAVVRGLERATRELALAVQREAQEREAHARTLEGVARAKQLETAGRLVGGVAHDLNNLLTPIAGYSKLLLEHQGGDPEVREAAQAIVSASTSAAGLARQLLAFARPGTQARVPVDLHQVLESTFTLLRRTLGKTVTLELKPVAPRCRVSGDAALLQNAFVNLALNARDAMPQGGLFTITTQVVDGFIEVVARDSGTGMSPEVQARAFEPFFSTKPQGVGLGLASVYSTAQNHAGTVSLASAVGVGTTFTLRFPLIADEPVTAPAHRAPADDAKPAGQTRVLVVDDEALVRSVILRCLTRKGYDCSEAGDGVAGFAAWQADRERVRLLVIDSEMPRMSGPQLLAKIRVVDPNLPVLIVSGFIRDANADALSKDPRVRLLPKPFTPESLLEAVEGLLRN